MKVNDYVRTKDGVIAKITDIIEDFSIDCDRGVFDLNDGMLMMEIPWNFKEEYIIKSSPNIIDLIEVGDYVNGMQVTRICFDEDGQRILNLSNCILELMNEDIKSIVTKEQFERCEYKI